MKHWVAFENYSTLSARRQQWCHRFWFTGTAIESTELMQKLFICLIHVFLYPAYFFSSLHILFIKICKHICTSDKMDTRLKCTNYLRPTKTIVSGLYYTCSSYPTTKVITLTLTTFWKKVRFSSACRQQVTAHSHFLWISNLSRPICGFRAECNPLTYEFTHKKEPHHSICFPRQKYFARDWSKPTLRIHDACALKIL